MTISNQKPDNDSENDSDLLTTAAKAIGTTLGQIAVKTGIAKAPAPAPKVQKKVASKKKALAAKGATRAARKTVTKKSPTVAKSKTPAAKGRKRGKG